MSVETYSMEGRCVCCFSVVYQFEKFKHRRISQGQGFALGDSSEEGKIEIMKKSGFSVTIALVGEKLLRI